MNTFRTCFAVCFLTGAGGFFYFKKFFKKIFGKTAILGVHFIPLCPNE
ncbi:hypothetical protein HMPREF3293_01157 [Christensenella minuta]|uniref:Uncharacterized protein n=1 Tax=Christensenella minuta TaxID=626937 RepID=A0A136Q5Q9_9FIRM|nr:hypothetical protein HMPREF3293_01157 [Christensenella minuta]